MPDTIWWEKWDPWKGGHHFLQKNVFFFIVRRESLKKIRSENQRDWVNSAGRRDSENDFRAAGFGKFGRSAAFGK